MLLYMCGKWGWHVERKVLELRIEQKKVK